MKVKIFIILFFIFSDLVFINSAYSQFQSGGGFFIGTNLARLTGEHKFENSSLLIAPCIGFTFNLERSYEKSIEFGIYYSRLGMKYENLSFDFGKRIEYKVKNTLDYAMLPVFYKQYFGYIYTKIGGFVALGLQARSRWEQKIDYIDSSVVLKGEYLSFSRDFNNLEAGGGFEAGFQYNYNKYIDWAISFSYRVGIIKITDNDTFYTSACYNRFFLVGLTIIYHEPAKRFKTSKRRR